MTENEAIETIKACLYAEDSIPVKLNLREGIDRELVTKLFEAMEYLTDIYKNSRFVPKELAMVFIDISTPFERAYSLYSEKEQEEIFDIKEKIVELAEEIFSV
ncbi:hypothetical protein [Hahella sp. NBU794]|uniref:hypothetical protein n=1 Tax=Hahella sp. NBU794 TaxID=3422590 RepID=UPI003D6F4645